MSDAAKLGGGACSGMLIGDDYGMEASWLITIASF
jgi:hypothetical protein